MNRNTENREQKFGLKNALFLFSIFCILFSTIGCDAFVRKFTRKPKNKELPTEEIILLPEEYAGRQISKEEQCRGYLVFWKSWQSELTASLLENRSQKKQLDCLKEAIKNLLSLKPLLDKQMQDKLSVYIKQSEELSDEIARDPYGTRNAINAKMSESIRRAILKDFSYAKIKDHLL